MFKCEQCPYTTFAKDKLKTHSAVVHEKIKNHFCEECGYGAYLKHAVDNHRRSAHGKGGQKFKCKKCSYSSVFKTDLEKHILAVHDKVKNHVCSECGYATFYKAILKRHMDYVHSVHRAKFKCQDCDASYKRMEYLDKHRKVKHPQLQVPSWRRRNGEVLKSKLKSIRKLKCE